jgi:dephospho-CoA kinase
VLRVGLTGGIASGKSHVLRRLAERGLAVVDLDEIARGLTAVGGAAYPDVVAAFGRGILAGDGSIDRAALGEIVFGDAAARARLEALLHPRVREEELRHAAALERAGARVLVSDAALLVEAGAHLRFERLVVVHCSPEQQLARLVRRDGLSEPAARARIDAQMPAAEKRRFAHAVVDSSGSPAETDEAADALARRLLDIVGRPRGGIVLREGAALGALAHGDGPGPRGLSAGVLLEEALAVRGIELVRLARVLLPPASAPWYRAARDGEGPPWPESLSAALALWAAARHDEEWLASAAASLCRLTHSAESAIAGAVLAAVAVLAVAGGEPLPAVAGQLERWRSLATRWGGSPPAPRVERAVSAAAACMPNAVEARRRAALAGGEPTLAGALVGLATGPSQGAEPRLAELAFRLTQEV